VHEVLLPIPKQCVWVYAAAALEADSEMVVLHSPAVV